MEQVEHKGVVKSVDKGKIVVDITVESACASCHLKGACFSGDIQRREVEVNQPHDKNFGVGDNVTLFFSEKKANLLVVLSYIIPIIICIGSLLVLTHYKVDELYSALYSLAFTAIYFVALKIVLGKFKNKIEIKIK